MTTSTTSRRARRIKRWLAGEAGQKWTHRAPVLVVAVVALYVSYWHIRHVCLMHGYDPVSAAITPFSVDGLVIVAARYITRAKTPAGKAAAAGSFVAGVLATLAGNILTAQPDPVGYGTAVWPAVAVVLTGLVLHWGDRKPARLRTSRTGQVSRTP